MTSMIDLGGHPMVITEDRFPDGRKCVVASHPDLPGCTVYAENQSDAMTALREAREAYLASLQRHEGRNSTPRSVGILPNATMISGAGLRLQTA